MAIAVVASTPDPNHVKTKSSSSNSEGVGFRSAGCRTGRVAEMARGLVGMSRVSKTGEAQQDLTGPQLPPKSALMCEALSEC